MSKGILLSRVSFKNVLAAIISLDATVYSCQKMAWPHCVFSPESDSVIGPVSPGRRMRPMGPKTAPNEAVVEPLACNYIQVVNSDQRYAEREWRPVRRRDESLLPATMCMRYTRLKSLTKTINRAVIYRFPTKPGNGESCAKHSSGMHARPNLRTPGK